MSEQPLVLKHNNWPDLLNALSELSDDNKRLKRIPEEKLKSFLWPAVSLAYLIALKLPELLKRDSIRILVAGAEINDSLDDGMWYHFIPNLLSRKMQLQVDIIGPNIGGSTAEDYKDFDFTAPKLHTVFQENYENPSHIYKRKLKEHLGYSDTDNSYNLCMLFHPWFERDHIEWLDDGGLTELVALGIPICGASYFSDEYVHDRLYLEAYGAEKVGDAIENPFAIPVMANTSYLAHTLWMIEKPKGLTSQLCNRSLLNLAELLTRMFNDYISQGNNPKPLHEVLKRVDLLISETDQNISFMTLPYGYILEESSGAIYRVDTNNIGELHYSTDIENHDLKDVPEQNAPLFDRITWAMAILLSYRLVPKTEEDITLFKQLFKKPGELT